MFCLILRAFRAQRRLIAFAIVLLVLSQFLYQKFLLQSHPTTLVKLTWGQGGRNIGQSRLVKISYNWAAQRAYFPTKIQFSLPPDNYLPIPRIQHGFAVELSEDRARLDSYRLEVRAAFLDCWHSYKKLAWMKDELTPVSGKAKNTLGGWAATLIDSLDTLWIMGLENEFREAVEAVATIDWEKTEAKAVNTFETTIRHLGGLLSAYDLSGEKVLLVKATELGDLLYAGFDRPNHLPGFWIDFNKAKNGGLESDNHLPLASPGSLCLEFTRLSQLTGDAKYYDAISRVTSAMEEHQNRTRIPGLWPAYVNFHRTIDFHGNDYFTLGALADSAYEYLPKMHALLSGRNPAYSKMMNISFSAIKENLIFRPMIPDQQQEILFTGDVRISPNGNPILVPSVQHLGCFAGGMMALGGRLLANEEYVTIGSQLTNGCIWAYEAFPTGIMPEIFTLLACKNSQNCQWNEERWRKLGGPHLPKGFEGIQVSTYLLRPEAIESVFILYRITGHTKYQEAARRMYLAIMNATKTKYGNSAIANVMAEGQTDKLDSMESFWMAETLKYFYLIFSPPEIISLDEYVFNTEAHPLRRTK